MRTAAPGWRTRARGAQTGLLPVEAAVVDAKDERRENAMRGPAAASETERGLPRRYLSEAGRARGPAARAAPEHVHIWRSFRTPDAHWLARPGHVGPRARPRPLPHRPQRPRPRRPRALRTPRARPCADPRAGRGGGCPPGVAGRAAGPNGQPRPGTAALWGRARLHPETAWPRARPRPKPGCVPAARPHG